MSKQPLEERVRQAAEAALADHHYVSAIDVLTGMRLLEPVHVAAWRKGRIDSLETMIQGSLNKISRSMQIFRAWAEEKGLQPSHTRYVRATRAGTVDLQFSVSGDADIEKFYSTHYVSPVLSERKREKLQQRLEEAPKPVVFQILRDSQCVECKTELPGGSLLYMDAEKPLCASCAGLSELVYLPAGDATLTRRATKYSQRAAVVVRFSRSRGRYERQGILVESTALEKAERELRGD
ncbi:MAG: hypothetical protein ACR2NN_16995 [Bryobacteraceae bacterium]